MTAFLITTLVLVLIGLVIRLVDVGAATEWQDLIWSSLSAVVHGAYSGWAVYLLAKGN
jgi:hypothetical protein